MAVAEIRIGDRAVVARVEYGPYGEILRQDGVAPAPFGFSTKYTDAETGLLYFGYRFYEPRAGRWLSRDPLEEAGGINLYGFNDNDPLSQIDPLGQSPISIIAKAAVKVGIKKALKEYVENRIKREILGAIRDRSFKRAAKEIGEEALEILDTLDSAWWEIGIELIPVAGDVYGGTKLALKLREANRKLEALERRAAKLAKEAAEKARRLGGGGKPPTRFPKKVAGGFDDAAERGLTKASPQQLKAAGFQDHHIISDKNALTKNHDLLSASGFDLQSRANKIWLPTDASLHPTRSLHLGRHWNSVSGNLASQMDEVLAFGRSSGWNQQQFRAALDAIIREERALLRSGDRALNSIARPGAH